MIWLLFVTLIGIAIALGYVLPGGDEIVYANTLTSRNTQFVNIILKDMSRNIQSRLTERYGINAVPNWSPDGQQIAYLSFDGQQFEVYVMDALGRHKRHIPLEFTAIDEGIWSPDSERILFSITVQGQAQSVVVNVATGQTNILPQAILSATWTSDGQTLIYQAQTEDGTPHLYGMNIACFMQPQSCEFKELAILQNQTIYDKPAWSPDGRSIVFTNNNGDHPKIVVAHLRCTDLVETCVEGYADVGETSYPFSPIWSADSKRLVFARNDTEIDVVQVETRVIQPFTVSNGFAYLQNWSPDGRFVIYTSNSSALLGNASTFLLDVTTGESRPLFPNDMTVESVEWRPTPH